MKKIQKVLSSSVIIAALVSLAAPTNAMPVKTIDLTAGHQTAKPVPVQYEGDGYLEGVVPDLGVDDGYGGAPGIVGPDTRDGFLNGHRGYRERRAGYREYRGYWYPLEAFPEGIVDGPIRTLRAQPALSARHVSWCSNRWRSYRSSDNSYQPSKGPRRECISPFSR